MAHLIMLLVIAGAHADDWFCKDQASEIKGNSIYACGIGEGNTENEARAKAFAHATDEYNKLCANSETCPAHESIIDPKRTDCGPKKPADIPPWEYYSNKEPGFKCYRLLVFTETDQPRRVPDNMRVALFNVGKDKRKIYIGEGSRKLVSDFGAPNSVYVDANGNKDYYYSDPVLCQYDGSPNHHSCSVHITSWGHIDRYDRVNTQVLGDL